MAGKIFINYRRDDASHALAVARYLGKRNIFIDIHRLQPGLKFKTVLEDKLRQCKVMLAIIGPNWVDARDEKTGNRPIDDPEDWVRVEIERARRSRGRRVALQVRLSVATVAVGAIGTTAA